MFKKYYENTRHFTCIECDKDFSLNFWQWLFVAMKFDFCRCRYVKCPHCGERHWHIAKKVM